MGYILPTLVVALLAFGFHVYQSFDYGRSVYNHRPGVCNPVRGPVNGSEDIELIMSEGIAFVTSGVIYLQTHRSHVKGKIFLYDFNNDNGKNRLEAMELPIEGDSFDKTFFHPHGISHWVVNGLIRLYVICHNDEFKHSVQFFDYDPSRKVLIHKKTIKDPFFIRPNGIVAVGPDQFILTNDGVAQTYLANLLEVAVSYNGGTVVYWDGKDAHQILSGMAGPNGLAYDVETNKLFLTEVQAKRMHVYELAKDKTSTTLISTINLYSFCDNLFLDIDGSLYTACHPLLHEAAKAVSDCAGDATSASQVLRIKYDSDYKTASVTEPYMDDGKQTTGSAVAVVYNKQMLIGTVCKILVHCEISDASVL